MMVITKNIYLKLALERLCRQDSLKVNVCIFDISSFSSISEMEKMISSLHIPLCYRFALLGGSDLCTKALFDFNVISMRLCISELTFSINKGITLISVIKFLNECNTLSIFTSRQKLIINGLRCQKSITEISNELGISAKTVYDRANNAARRINLRSFAELIHILRDDARMMVKL
ncbi:LuxR C-terminal-related transcriptional regulator [Citrobacter farmeri]|uniref:LuxR C-terminal-related transcriptional regulator n=1 Tax=Citrobacter farmeri TaxID=67824 RepID=UPI0019026314|nr:LuxR C-terminal-related transcriptional regulator [Citrobacter farmeri]MBJ9136105.1 hypothetical protein [Citrobacter farmeri]